MSAFTPATFITPPLLLRPSTFSHPLLPRSPRHRHTRPINTPPTARSLESYREGHRFPHKRSSRPRPSTSAKHKPLQPSSHVKQRIALTQALCIMNIASLETCGLLIRSGCVRVNGIIVKDDTARVDRGHDFIMVNDVDYGTVEQVERGVVMDEEVDEWQMLPRRQKDLYRPGSARAPEAHQKYSRRVDRGFYSRRRYNGGR